MYKYSIINMINKKVLNHITAWDEKNLQYLGWERFKKKIIIIFHQKFDDGCFDEQGTFMSKFRQHWRRPFR